MSATQASAPVEDTTVLSEGKSAKPATIASIYVGDLESKVVEDQLLELFRPIGPILSVRICRDIITRRSLGYGYVNFQDAADAETALKTLNFTEVNGRQMRLMWQQRDPSSRYSGSGNVFVKNLAESIDHKALYELFAEYGSIVSCKVMKDEGGASRRYGFVHFKEDDTAKSAIAKLNNKKPTGAEDALYVANFIRRNARIAALLENFTNVYVKQVLPNIEQKDIEKFFAKFGGITSAVARKDSKGRVFAFCNFSKHEEAVKCIDQLHQKTTKGLSDGDEPVYVQRAQTRSERLIELRQIYMQRQSVGNNLYIRNFDPEYTAENLSELFQGFGEIKNARVMSDEAGSPRGFGFICFATAEQANHALKEMNGRMLNGKPLIVNIAQRRDHRTSMLQVQFQQRLQAMLQRLPMTPFIASGPMGPKPGMRSMRGSKQPGQAPKQQRQPAPAAAAPHHIESTTVHVGKKSAPVSPQVAPATPPLAPLKAAELLAMSPDEQKVALGERLYVKVHEISPEAAPKITGMFLEMDVKEALAMLENPVELKTKVDEAMCVLRAHKK